MCFASLSATNGKLARLVMVPTRIRTFMVQSATALEAGWRGTLNREGKRFGTWVQLL